MREIYEEGISKYQVNNSFIMSCCNGMLKEVKDFLNSEQLIKMGINADIHANRDEGLRLACRDGRLEVIRYLLTSPELKEHADINALEGEPLASAAENGHLDVVKYLLTSPELKEHANIHDFKDCAFKWAVDYERMEVLRYFIFDMNIEKTQHIEIYLKNDGSNPICQTVNNWFNMRELNKSLQEELPNEEIKNNKKPKI